MILEDIPHYVGHHCSSSALKTALAYDGIELSEALIFGLASGLGFFYSIEDKNPSRRFNGRAPDLEGNFYKLIDTPLDWAKKWDLSIIEKSLENKRPLIAQTDIFAIPYYDDSHFIGHGLLLVGLKEDAVVVADIAASNFLEMPISAFRASVDVEHYPLLEPYHYATMPELKSIDIKKLAPIALEKTILYMLEPPSPNEGLTGMMFFAGDLVNWADLNDSQFVARFGYQAIEKRGTGGGNFRYLFADFLTEINSQKYKDVIFNFRYSAKLWTNLASKLKQAAFCPPAEQKELFVAAAEIGKKIVGLETDLFNELKSLTS